VQSLGERVDLLDVVVPDLDLVPRQLREAVERAQRVEVVVEDGDLQLGTLRRMRSGRAGVTWPLFR